MQEPPPNKPSQRLLVATRRFSRRRYRRVKRWVMRAQLDMRDSLSGRRDPLLPPRRMNLPSQIAAVGDLLVDMMIGLGGMQPDAAVLDIGCGPGRTAAPLTRYLDPDRGSYEGFDVMPKSIDWGRKAISSKHPRFRFQLADLHNAQYNPGGTQEASKYRFPYEDATFDVAVAASLFTHLRPFEARRYLEETARVLRPEGRLLGSWFLLNEESRHLIGDGRARAGGVFGGEEGPPLELIEFTDERGLPFSSSHAVIPEYMIVADEEMVRSLHEMAGLRVVEVRYGHWAGRDKGADRFGQDVLVAERS